MGDLSRAARARRRELEKLMKTVKAREPDRRCYLTYDRLVVDDNVYIFNELEGRVERLPHKTATSSSSLDISNMTDTYNDTGHSFRQGQQQSVNIRRGMSVECLLDRIPPAASLVSEPRLSSAARKSLESVLEGGRPASRQRSTSCSRERRSASRPLSRATSSEGKK